MAMKGKSEHLARLRRLLSADEVVANRVVYVGADLIRSDAHHSISRGSVSGKKHVPSAPGDPPNRDTGHLQIYLTTSQPAPLIAEVRSDAEYGAALEFGTSKMSARPYLRPARDKNVGKIQRLFQKEMGIFVKRSGNR